MAMTTLSRDLQSSSPEAPTMEPPSSRQGLFGWLVVAVALVAATVLAALVLTGGDDPAEPRPWYSVERGSITAIDHAAEAAEVANRPSIASADHTAAATAQTPADVSAEHGSITALDHAAESAGSPADVSAERGSITALDHAAEDEATEDDTTGTG